MRAAPRSSSLDSSWDSARHDRSATGAGFDRELTVHNVRAITHDADPDTFDGVSIFGDANSIVGNAQARRAVIGAESDVDLAGLAMLGRIVNRLLSDAVEMSGLAVLADAAFPGRFKGAVDRKQSARGNGKFAE